MLNEVSFFQGFYNHEKLWNLKMHFPKLENFWKMKYPNVDRLSSNLRSENNEDLFISWKYTLISS